ncbi:MAG: hypothetical protein HOP33_21440 [Verrucomicrobia bacterium]|nr:hypothetical protein [Verrucomicrobiota bacterium]
MKEIIGFFVMAFASLFDPIRTPGYIISGWAIKNLPGALVASILWNVLIYGVIIMPIDARLQSSTRADLFFASCLGGVFMTGIVYFFASRRRKRQQAEMAAKKDNDENKPSG